MLTRRHLFLSGCLSESMDLVDPHIESLNRAMEEFRFGRVRIELEFLSALISGVESVISAEIYSSFHGGGWIRVSDDFSFLDFTDCDEAGWRPLTVSPNQRLGRGFLVLCAGSCLAPMKPMDYYLMGPCPYQIRFTIEDKQ